MYLNYRIPWALVQQQSSAVAGTREILCKRFILIQSYILVQKTSEVKKKGSGRRK